MSRAQNFPPGTPDPYIAMKATQARAMGAMQVQWAADRVRLALGQVEVIPRDSEEDARLLRRTLRRSTRPEPEPGPPARFLPTHTDEHGQGWGVLIRDKPL